MLGDTTWRDQYRRFKCGLCLGLQNEAIREPGPHYLVFFNWINKNGNSGNLDQRMGCPRLGCSVSQSQINVGGFHVWAYNTSYPLHGIKARLPRSKPTHIINSLIFKIFSHVRDALIYQPFGIGLWIFYNAIISGPRTDTTIRARKWYPTRWLSNEIYCWARRVSNRIWC